MFSINKDFDKLEKALERYFYYLYEIEKGNYMEFEDKRIEQHKKIAEILEVEPESCATVLHNVQTEGNPGGHSPRRATQLLCELKINNLLINLQQSSISGLTAGGGGHA